MDQFVLQMSFGGYGGRECRFQFCWEIKCWMSALSLITMLLRAALAHQIPLHAWSLLWKLTRDFSFFVMLHLESLDFRKGKMMLPALASKTTVWKAGAADFEAFERSLTYLSSKNNLVLSCIFQKLSH